MKRREHQSNISPSAPLCFPSPFSPINPFTIFQPFTFSLYTSTSTFSLYSTMRHLITSTPHVDPTRPLSKKRGSYNCGRCGLPKKGHVCGPHPTSRPQRVLSFDDLDVGDSLSDSELPAAVEVTESGPGLLDPDEVVGGVPIGCLWEVLTRLSPSCLMAASGVCNGWREVAARVWSLVDEIKIRVPISGSVGFVGHVLKKCSSLVKISLHLESDLDATMLACIAFSCPNLESMKISTSGSAVNRITGDELSRFIADRRCLTNLKMEGCSNLGTLLISSSSLLTLWLSDLQSLSKTVFSCPNLREVSLNFSHQENDTTDLTTLMDNIGKGCPRLQNIHVASTRLSHATVLALTDANLRGLRMLSLVFGSGITDASVAAIAYTFSKLEHLDLSGSSISDSGIGMICNVFSRTLSRLLLALCPNITSSGIQFATAQLPFLELMDCGMTICDDADDVSVDEGNDFDPLKTPNSKSHHIYQKLIIKHNRLKKLSLWGCSGLDALYLNCPDLNDLNLMSCQNLHPERLLLQCPNLESIHAANCINALCRTIESQVNNTSPEGHLLSKRMADGSKRVRVPHMLSQHPSEDTKEFQARKRRCTVFVT